MRNQFRLLAVNALALLLIVACSTPAGAQENATDPEKAVKDFITSFGSRWDMAVLKRWADPSFSQIIARDSSLQNTFSDVYSKLGGVKAVTSTRLTAPPETARRMYLAGIECEKGPLRMSLELDLVGNLWKVRQIGLDSKLLATAGPNQQTLARLKQYVDYVIPKLGRKWDFAEFQAEADPRMFQSSGPVPLKTMYTQMTGLVGPIVSYQGSTFANAGVKNGAPIGSYKARFTGRSGEGLAVVTVTFDAGKYRITDLNIMRKMGR